MVVQGELKEYAAGRQARQPEQPRCYSACNIGSDAILVQRRLFCAD
jgi:hypothetical protein